MDQWYYTDQGKRLGPVPLDQLIRLAAAGRLQRSDLVWRLGLDEWVEARTVKGLFPAAIQAPTGSPLPLLVVSAPSGTEHTGSASVGTPATPREQPPIATPAEKQANVNGRKVFSNEAKLLRIVRVAWAVWTCFVILWVYARLFEIDRKRESPQYLAFLDTGPSKTAELLSGLVLWGVGLGGIGAGVQLFRKLKYQIEYEGTVIQVSHSAARKALFVDNELQAENDDFSFGRVELQGRIKSGQAAGKKIEVSCAGVVSAIPVRVVVDNSVVFSG